MAGIYVHIPFCRSRCAYCDFFSCTNLAGKADFLEKLEREIAFRSQFLGDNTIKTIYLGGGTPSLLSADDLAHILGAIGRTWDLSQVAETTVEANPDDMTPAWLEGARAAGFDRLSIGIQSLDDDQLRYMNRRHDAASAIEAVNGARRAGFGNISIDLIYGVPGSTAASWARNIERALALRPEHISAYHLTIEEGTPLHRSGAEPVDEALSEEQYLLLHNMLTSAGYDHYEISNFALPGRRSRHNSSYWSGESYLGLGPSAHSFDGGVRSWSPRSLEHYLAAPLDSGFYESETLSARDRYNEYLMTRLRTSAGVDTGEAARLFGARKLQDLLVRAQRFVDSGVCVHDGNTLRIRPEKFLISDEVIASLFE